MDKRFDFRILLKSALWNSLRNVRCRPFQTITTSLCIAIGTAAVVLTVHTGLLGKELLNQELDGMGFGSYIISADAKAPRLSPSEVSRFQKQTYIEKITPIQPVYTTAKMCQKSEKAMIWGVNEEAPELISMELLYGRQITRADVISCSNVCTVDVKTARDFYKRDNIVGKKIKLQIRDKLSTFTVIGVVQSGGALFQSNLSAMVPDFVYVPYTSLIEQQGKNGVDQIALSFSEEYNADTGEKAVLKDALQILEKNTEDKQYTIQNLSAHQKSFSKIMTLAIWIIGGIAGISFLVAGVGMSSVMTLSVREQTKEIGIKKSLGAQPEAILLEYWLESFTISFLGSIMGISVSLILLLTASFFGIPIIWRIDIMIICAVSGSLSGSLFGLKPAWTACRMDPVEALHCD